MENDVSNAEISCSAGSCVENNKKLKLFGFELNPKNQSSMEGGGGGGGGDHESVNSSNTVSSFAGENLQKLSATDHHDSNKKFECQYCFKEFANSQALGGHQNAHKKERMKKKRLQLQARRASINCYLQPYQNSLSYYNHHGSSTTPWFYDPSVYNNNDQFTVYEESQISFNSFDHHHHHHQDANSHQSDQVSKWSSLPTHHHRSVPFQQDSCVFTLTHTERSGESRPLIIKPASAAASKQSCKSLDLQLGLSLQPTVQQGSSRSSI